MQNGDKDLLGIVERLVDNLQETNSANTEMLRSVNISLTKISETIPEIKDVSDALIEVKEEIRKLEGPIVVSGIRCIINKIKTATVVFTVVISLSSLILGLYQYKVENSITEKFTEKVKIVIQEQINLFELRFDRKDR